MNEQLKKERLEKYLGWIYDLSCSTGLYGRLLRHLQENEEAMNYLAEQDFKEPLDLVLWYEC